MSGDAGARRDAATRTDKNVVLRASAGTGKTTVLVERILCLLLRDGLDPERLVAITFTEAAAAEMKSRVRRALHDAFLWGQGEDVKLRLDEAITAGGRDQVRVRAQQAIERLDRAVIETIHAFAGRLLRTFPEEAGVDASFAIEEETAVAESLRRSWAAWSRAEMAEDSPRLDRWRPVLKALRWGPIEELAFRLADFEDIPEDPGEIPEAAKAWVAGLIARVAPLVKSAKKRLKVVEQAEAAVDALRQMEASGWKKAPEADGPLDDDFSKSYASVGWTDDDWQAARSAFLAAKAWAAVRPEAAEAVRLLAGFAKEHQESCLRAGRLSFQALLTLARDLLRRRPRAAARFRDHRFLVDEFQDTDEKQAEIVLRLASDPPHGKLADWRDLRPREGALFVVGDAKQSIYSWRGADLGVYDAVAAQLVGAGALDLELARNFRSQPAVIDAANAVFRAAFRPETGIQAPPADLEATRSGQSLTGRIVQMRVAPVGPEDNAPAKAGAEARAIANWIIEARAKLKIETEDNGVVIEKYIRFRDIAILLRSTTYLQEYLHALREARIPYVVTREQHFYEAQEVRDAINLLLALVRPDDALSLSGVLRSPVGGLTFDEIHALGRPDYRRHAAGRAGELFARLLALRTRALRLPVPEAVDLILDDSGLRTAAAAAAHGEQALANLEKISALAARWASPELTLSAFADLLGQRLLATEREAESPLGEPDDEVVRVSTIHGAKGLEWPVVILGGLHQQKRGGRNDDPVLSGPDGFAARVGDALTPAWAWLEDRRRRRAEAEDVRLFYVACTRARESLILSRAGDGRGAFLPMIPDKTFPEVTADASPSRGYSPPTPVPFPDAALLEAWEDRRMEFERAMGLPAIDSPTGLMHREDTAAREFGHSWHSPDAKNTGILVHRVLERWNFAGDDLDAALNLAAADLRPDERAGALPRARKLLAAFLDTPDAREIAASTVLGREIPFAMPLADGRCITGAIDVLFESKDGRLHIRDYKTGRENKKYETQQGVYLAAVRKLFPGREATFRLIYMGGEEG